jgi:hypothetical protein
MAVHDGSRRGLLLERCKRESVGAEMAGPQNTTRDGSVLAFHPSHRLAVTSPICSGLQS